MGPSAFDEDEAMGLGSEFLDQSAVCLQWNNLIAPIAHLGIERICDPVGDLGGGL